MVSLVSRSLRFVAHALRLGPQKAGFTRHSALLALLPAFLLSPLGACAAPSTDLVVGSSHIAGIVDVLSEGTLTTRLLIPPGSCPGHYDMKPSDLEAAANCRALIIHSYQRQKANVLSLIKAINDPDPRVKVISTEGNWMVPAVQANATAEIARVLCDVDPTNCARYQQLSHRRQQTIVTEGADAKDRLAQAGADDVKVVCAEIQAGFIEWAGFDIIAVYGRPEGLSVADMVELVDEARQAGVAVVIDNLQSGDTANSEAVAREIGCEHVVISNFPGAFPHTETWEKALYRNIDLLLQTLGAWRQQHV